MLFASNGCCEIKAIGNFDRGIIDSMHDKGRWSLSAYMQFIGYSQIFSAVISGPIRFCRESKWVMLSAKLITG